MTSSLGISLISSALILTSFAYGCGGTSNESTPPPPPVQETITIVTAPNVQCVQTVPFTLTLLAQGNQSPITWTITSGQLPTGLSLDSTTGTISGTPVTASGNVTIQAADAKASASQQFAFTVWTKLTINPVVPGPAHINAPYTQSVSGQGSSAIASWTVSGGQLPPGLTFRVSPSNLDTAIVSGIPTQIGTFNFTVQAQDYTLPQTATMNVTIVVDNHLAITKSTLKNGGQNQTYLDSFTAVNGTPPLHWSISGNFPNGLTLDAASGQITGTPTNFGGFPYAVSVNDSGPSAQTDSSQGILSIAQQLQIVGSLAPAYIGQFYNSGYVVIGGSYPYTWTLAAGNLPSGLTVTPGGTIQGTPTLLGSSAFTLQVTDSGSPPYIVTQPVTMNVVPTLLSVLGNPLSPAPVNVIYHSQIPGSGGTPPYTWSLSSGQLPPGLALDPTTGFIDGTPSQIGTYNFVAAATDSGSPSQTATANDFIQIHAGRGRNDSIATATPLGNSQNLQTPIPLSISPYIDPMNAATANPDTDFYKLVAVGGSSVHVETFAQRAWGADTLDSVLEILDVNGQRYSSCTLPAFTARCLNDDLDSTTLDSALDFKVPGPSTSQTTFFVHVFDWRGDARPDMQYYLNVSGVIEPISISPATLGLAATRGVNYQQQFTSAGGTGSTSWSVGSGSLPPGWSLANSGLLSGIAASDGAYSFSIRATDSGNPPQTVETQYSLVIAEPLVITTSAQMPNACVGQPYSFTMQSSGGFPPLTWGWQAQWPLRFPMPPVTSPNLVLSGTPQIVGSYTAFVGVIDSAQPPSGMSQNLSLNVVNCP